MNWIDELRELFTTVQASETRVTTGDGNVGATSLIDAGLIGAGVGRYISFLVIVNPGDLLNIHSSDVTGFNTVTGEVTFNTVDPGGRVLIGTPYKLVPFRFVPAEVAALTALVGTAADAADLGTLFGRHSREYLGTHTHALLVIHDTTAVDPDLDTALQQWLMSIGCMVTMADPADVAGNLEVSAFDIVIVSASCLVGDVGNLAPLNEVNAPVICHSAAIAASVVFSMGATPHTHAAQTEIEITDNTVMWLIAQALGDLVVTASAPIDAMNTITAASTELAQEATGLGNHITASRLLSGDQNEAGYAAFFDRYFVGVGDYTNMNAVWKAVMEDLVMHCIMEKRFTEEATVQVKGVFQENIPSPDFALVAIDNVLTNPPPTPDAANTIVEIDEKNNRTYVLRSIWVNVTSFGTAGTILTFSLWTILGGVPIEVDTVVVNVLGIQNLMDLFGLPEVYSDAIYITVITDSAGADAACSGTYNYAEAKK